MEAKSTVPIIQYGFLAAIFMTAVFALFSLDMAIEPEDDSQFSSTFDYVGEADANGYFPDLVFDERKERHDSVSDWYSSHLRAMNETSLLDNNVKTDLHSYRFLWLRTFHAPVAVRIDVDPAGFARLTLNVLDGAGGYDPGKIAIHERSEVGGLETARLLREIRRIGFWNMSTTEPSFGLDGTQWILEGVHSGRYHVVERWSPEQGNFRKLCLEFLVLSQFDVDPEALY